MAWFEQVQAVMPHVVRIETPTGHGTGFLRLREGNRIGIATAHHVISHADKWQQPIRLYCPYTDTEQFLAPGERVVEGNAMHDAALIGMTTNGLELPPTPIPLPQVALPLVPGSEVGWIGFPHIVDRACFFAGVISAQITELNSYYIDGVSIQGVSGGPAFCTLETGLHVIGVVSAYIDNQALGKTLPGLMIARDVSVYQQRDANRAPAR